MLKRVQTGESSMWLVALFVAAFIVGANAARSSFMQLAVLLFVVLALCGVLWQAAHGWPGIFNGAFVEVVGTAVVLTVLGLLIGGVTFGKQLRSGS